MTVHRYEVRLTWTGNRGAGTADRRSYGRDHELSAAGPATILGSSDPAFRGDPSKWNPEQLFLASLAQCHMLWYLDLAARAGVVVTAYRDEPTGEMVEAADGSGQFESVTLRPHVTITAQSDPDRALAIHDDVPHYCFIARSVNVPVHHQPTVVIG